MNTIYGPSCLESQGPRCYKMWLVSHWPLEWYHSLVFYPGEIAIAAKVYTEMNSTNEAMGIIEA